MPAGTIVSSGSLVSPGGQQGIPGPNAVSTDAGNQATWGSDNRIYVPRLASPVVEGGTVADTNVPNAIVVPSYAAHPDAIWSPMNAFDDHFDGSSLNAKWVQNIPASPFGSDPGGPFFISGSCLGISGVAAANDSVVYYCAVSQAPLNTSAFSVYVKVDAWFNANSPTSPANSWGAIYLQFRNTANNGTDRRVYGINSTATANVCPYMLWQYYGIGGATSSAVYISSIPKYFKFSYSTSQSQTMMSASMNGKQFLNQAGITFAQSGLSTSNPPQFFDIGIAVRNYGSALVSIDWVKFTNP